MHLDEACICSRASPAVDILIQWLSRRAGPILLAIDAPLGWPSQLSAALIDHVAGAEIGVQPNMMFRRATDRFVQEKLGKTPLDVGADRIARTAHSALAILGSLRQELGQDIPLAWSTDFDHISAIEVYPAATLIAHGIGSSGYKNSDQIARRQSIIESLKARVTISEEISIIRSSSDALDAAVCVLAGADFLRKRALDPEDLAVAKREGWIWFPLPLEPG